MSALAICLGIAALVFAALAIFWNCEADRAAQIALWRLDDIEALREQLADAQARNLRPGDTPLYLVSRDACRERGDLA